MNSFTMDNPESLYLLCAKQIAIQFNEIYKLRKELKLIFLKVNSRVCFNENSVEYQEKYSEKNESSKLNIHSMNSNKFNLMDYVDHILKAKPFALNITHYLLQNYQDLNNNNINLMNEYLLDSTNIISHNIFNGNNPKVLKNNFDHNNYGIGLINQSEKSKCSEIFKVLSSDLSEITQKLVQITNKLINIEFSLLNQFIYYHPGPIINDLILNTLDSDAFFNECVEWFLNFLLNIPELVKDKVSDQEILSSLRINKLVLKKAKISPNLLEDILIRKDWVGNLTDFDIFSTVFPLHMDGNEHPQKSHVDSFKQCQNLDSTNHLSRIISYLQTRSHMNKFNKGLKVLNLGPLTTNDLLKATKQTNTIQNKTKNFKKFINTNISNSQFVSVSGTQTFPIYSQQKFYGLKALTISELIKNTKNHSISSSSESENEDIMYTDHDINLNVLNKRENPVFKMKKFWQTFNDSLSSLVYLELNNADYLHPSEFSYLFKHLNNLTHLILHNSFSDDSIDPILKLVNLTYLDLSHSYAQTFPNRKFIMRSIIKDLPKLTELDISGTDLAGEICNNNKAGHMCQPYLTGFKKCKKRFKFLGLFNTPNNVSHCPNIPADTVTGDANEPQILLSLEAYRTRPDAMHKAITDLFLLFRYSVVQDLSRALENILSLMKDYKKDKNTILTCSACLFYLFKTDFKATLSYRATQRVITVVLECMENFSTDQNIIRNGLLTLFHFNIPDDILFAMDRTVKVLIEAITTSITRQGGPYSSRPNLTGTNSVNQPHVVDQGEAVNLGGPEDGSIYMIEMNDDALSVIDEELDVEIGDEDYDDLTTLGAITDQTVAPAQVIRVATATNSLGHLDELVLRLSVCVLNSLVCLVDTAQKVVTGQDLGVISLMIAVIRVRAERDICDEVLEIAWSTLWNITDETADNCECFLSNGGMDLFMLCLRKFPDKAELYRNMLGLLGNISEVPQLRPWLMQDEYVQIFYELLYNFVDGIEVAYNSAGIISHLLSDGPEAWSIKLPRAQVLTRLPDTIHRWNIDSKRNINYRSLEPILRLLGKFETPQIQHWSVWALANLTKVYPQKYCQLLEEENGIPLLKELILDLRPYEKIKQLATSVLKNVEMFNKGRSKTFSRNSSFTNPQENASLVQ